MLSGHDKNKKRQFIHRLYIKAKVAVKKEASPIVGAS